MDPPLSFGDWLQQRRKVLALTGEQLAQHVGCSISTLRKIESGERRPSLLIAELLANALDLPPAARPTFVKVARGDLNVERLPAPSPQPAQPAPTARPGRDRLPVNPTPLVGRQRELAELGQLLADLACRLLTLVGPGGVGKTRLAIDVARQAAETFADGVAFVPLAPLTSPRFIVPAIAEALGFTFSGPAEPQTQLGHYLRDKQLLLVLDNVEHLLAEGAAELLAELHGQARTVALLITSREVLNVQGEWVFQVSGLPVPANLTPAQATAGDAVELFLQRARRAQVAFAPMAEDYAAIVRICQLVEGLPLAVELAAAWVRVLSCPEIAAEIERSLDFLAAQARDMPARHRSMRVVFDHSWKLLAGEEQAALRRLAVFHGGFTRQAAEQVAGAPLAQLSALVAKSLVQRRGSGRYDLHELIRQYAAASLAAEAPEQRGVRQRHSLYFLGLLEEGGDLSSRPKESLTALPIEIGNIRSAWEWAAAHEDGARLCQVSIALWYLLEVHNWSVEGEMIFRNAAETLRGRNHAERSGSRQAALATARHLMLAHAAYFACRLGRLEEAYAALRSGAAAMRAGADPYAAIVVHWYLGIVCWTLGRFDEAHASLEESLAKSRAHGKVLHEAWSLEFLGFVAHDRGAYERARGYLSEALEAFRQTRDQLGQSHVLYAFGRMALALGEHAQAETLLGEGLALARAVGYPTAAAAALDGLGRLAQARGDLQAASGFYAESAALNRGMGEVRGYARVLTHQALNELAFGDAARAEQSLCTALRLAHECGSWPVVLEALAGLATVRSAEPDQALELVSLVLEHPASTQDAKNLAGQVSSQLRTHLRPEQVEAARQRAHSQELDEVVRQVLANA